MKRRNIKFLTKREIRKIIDICPDDRLGWRDRALLEVLFSTGLRISEALRLTIVDVVLDYRSGTREIVLTGKGGWQRVVYISPDVMKTIYRHLEYRIHDNQLLFPITPRQAQRMVKVRAKQAGVDKFVSPHVFRHSLATDLLSKGVDIAFVSKFLGHRNIANTMIYAHIINPQLRKIHEKLYK